MKYLVKHRDARKQGAIGIFYPISQEIEAPNKEAVEEKFRNLYETRNGSLEITEV